MTLLSLWIILVIQYPVVTILSIITSDNVITCLRTALMSSISLLIALMLILRSILPIRGTFFKNIGTPAQIF